MAPISRERVEGTLCELRPNGVLGNLLESSMWASDSRKSRYPCTESRTQQVRSLSPPARRIGDYPLSATPSTPATLAQWAQQ